MGLKFRCKACGEDVVVRFLKVGEAAECKTCGASNPVPESAESADDETAAPYQSRARGAVILSPAPTENIQLKKKLLGISLMVLGLIAGIALPLLMMSPEGRNPNAGHSVPGIILLVTGGRILERLRHKTLAPQQSPEASRPQDRKMTMEESGFGWGDQRASDDMSSPAKKTTPGGNISSPIKETKSEGSYLKERSGVFWKEVIPGIMRAVTLPLVLLGVIVAAGLAGFVILSIPYGWVREAWFPGISQTTEIILVTIVIPLLIFVAIGLFEILSEKWQMWLSQKK
mgnify:CR=1 FL=1